MNLRAPLGQAIPRRARWIAGIELLASVPRRWRCSVLLTLALFALIPMDGFGQAFPTVVIRRATKITLPPGGQAKVIQEGNSTVYFEAQVVNLGLGDTLTMSWSTVEGNTTLLSGPALTELEIGSDYAEAGQDYTAKTGTI